MNWKKTDPKSKIVMGALGVSAACIYSYALKCGLSQCDVKAWQMALSSVGFTTVLAAPLVALAKTSAGNGYKFGSFYGIGWSWTEKSGSISNLEACCLDCDMNILDATADVTKGQTRFHCDSCQVTRTLAKTPEQLTEQITRLVAKPVTNPTGIRGTVPRLNPQPV